jgi:hypothetical protein
MFCYSIKSMVYKCLTYFTRIFRCLLQNKIEIYTTKVTVYFYILFDVQVPAKNRPDSGERKFTFHGFYSFLKIRKEQN